MSDPGLPDLPDPDERPPGGDPGSVPDSEPEARPDPGQPVDVVEPSRELE